MSREKVEANNERKKNYKKYNRQVKRKKVTTFIPPILVTLVIVAFLAFGGYTAYSNYRDKNPSYTSVNLDAISEYNTDLQEKAAEAEEALGLTAASADDTAEEAEAADTATEAEE